jgi:hypothetical protein
MAASVFCDWCGEIMDVPDGQRPLELRPNGHGGNPVGSFAMFHTDFSFHYHAEYHYDSTLDPDCCLAKVKDVLAERASWAHDPDQSAEWRLVSRAGRTETIRENQHRRRLEMDEECKAKERRWKETPKEERMEMVRGILAEGGLTARELADRLSGDNDLRLHPESLRSLINEMYATGSLTREAEHYRNGPQTRYRYALTAAEEGAEV